ncbi:MAG: SDR family oxidoreductase [Rhodobacteraceae bacterium]|jgi:glucose 1-dehydrogenase|nr:SDR family oxidoreductase [Paracoccaceae bacterium]
MTHRGRHYIITGAAGGIGLATARLLAGRGAFVSLLDRRPPPDLPVGDAGFFACDVASTVAVEASVAAAAARFGVPHGLVTSAGIDLHHNFFDLTDSDFAHMLDVNVLGSFRAVQACARLWRANPPAVDATYAAVLLSSVNAVIATPTHTAYATSKGAVAQMVRAMAVELAPLGVRVNAMAPGTVQTAMLDRLEADRPDALRKILDRTPMGRVARPDEIATGIAFLLGAEADYVTGQTLFADGGRTVQNLPL